MQYILWFEELNKDSIPLAGGKGANLGEMVNLKLPVPAGFVVSTKAFNYFLETSGIKSMIDELIDNCDVENTEQLMQTSREIKELILKNILQLKNI